MTALAGYGTGTFAPGISGIGTSTYIVAHNQIRAHAYAYRVYNEEFRPTQNGTCDRIIEHVHMIKSELLKMIYEGEVGITLNTKWAEPENPEDPEYVAAAERVLQFGLGWFAHPIFINGDYPQVMKDKVSCYTKHDAIIEYYNFL